MVFSLECSYNIFYIDMLGHFKIVTHVHLGSHMFCLQSPAPKIENTSLTQNLS